MLDYNLTKNSTSFPLNKKRKKYILCKIILIKYLKHQIYALEFEFDVLCLNFIGININKFNISMHQLGFRIFALKFSIFNSNYSEDSRRFYLLLIFWIIKIKNIFWYLFQRTISFNSHRYSISYFVSIIKIMTILINR